MCEMVSIIASGAHFEAAINYDGQEDHANANDDDQEYNIAWYDREVGLHALIVQAV